MDVAWYCQNCGRFEAPKEHNYCPDCHGKANRCSRYEWFFSDALRSALMLSGRKYKIKEQYPIADHRGFYWYWDLFVWIEGSSIHDGYGLLIDIQGPNHKKQKKYSGPGGGYTRDYDKEWELLQQRFHKRGIEHRYIENSECKKRVARDTAYGVLQDLIYMADHYT